MSSNTKATLLRQFAKGTPKQAGQAAEALSKISFYSEGKRQTRYKVSSLKGLVLYSGGPGSNVG